MGMNYKYAGSASYSRFDEEFRKLIKDIGIKFSEEPTASNEDLSFDSMYGLDPRNATIRYNYEFPEDTPQSVKAWILNPYNTRSNKDVNEIINYINQKIDIIKVYSLAKSRDDKYRNAYPYEQILYELFLDFIGDENWCIS